MAKPEPIPSYSSLSSTKNTALTLVEVKKVAKLARLAIGEGEMEKMTENLSTIVAFVAQLDSADTSQVEPMAHPLHAVQRLREDAVTEVDQRELYQRNAPEVKAGLYLVPQVIES